MRNTFPRLLAALPDAITAAVFALAWIAAFTYIIGALANVMLPLPALGITSEFIRSMHLSGSGEWIERPYTVLAFGTLYFGVQSWLKYALSGSDDTQLAAIVKSRAARRQSQ